MTYFNDLHTYLHQSSLLIQAYPSARITTKYSLPRKPNPKSKSKKNTSTPDSQPKTQPDQTSADTANQNQTSASTSKREPSATLTLKTYHPESGICLKYRTDKAAEVGRLINGLGKLAKGEIIEMPIIPVTNLAGNAGGDKLDIDSTVGVTEGASAVKMEDTVVTTNPSSGNAGQGQGAGGGKKKKKGKK